MKAPVFDRGRQEEENMNNQQMDNYASRNRSWPALIRDWIATAWAVIEFMSKLAKVCHEFQAAY